MNAPSPRYTELLEQYRHLHTHGAPELGIQPDAMFPGQSLIEHLATLEQVVRGHGIETMLDYGCGKALLYRPINEIVAADGRRCTCIQEWLGLQVTLFDPAYPPYMDRPDGIFDLVVCTDVLEHVAAQDVPWVLSDLFNYATKFVYGNIACYPAKKTLPNGENAHCTIMPVEWWSEQITAAAESHPSVAYEFVCTSITEGERTHQRIARALH